MEIELPQSNHAFLFQSVPKMEWYFDTLKLAQL